MSFQDIRNNGGIRPASSSTPSQTPSQSVAAGIFQINTAVSSFRRLVQAIGTSKDTPAHRQKLHDTRQRILQLVKDTSAKLKALSDSDHASNVTYREQAELKTLFPGLISQYMSPEKKVPRNLSNKTELK